MKVVDNKDKNIKKAVQMIKKAGKNSSDMVILPEMFNCPYDNQKFVEYSEEQSNSKTLKKISEVAGDCGVYIIAGSIPESQGDRIYNTSFTFNPEGKVIAVHRKLHLFDINIPGSIYFMESDTLSAGDKVTVFDSKYGKIGVAICYDLRFPEIFRLMALNGANLIIVPGAFNMKTGPAHWEVLTRSRAVDNQVFVVAASPARNEDLSYVAYGNSMIVGPWGEVITCAGEGEEIIYADLKLSEVEKVRSELPLLKNRRTDIYDVIKK
ncbi:MAG: carbon-nitrogen hydrolase family protein [Methanobacteriaceae archaeon]|jgi:predicted amidohydrolase|nr:MAG: carbon-nitrogen hydrolase [Methanobacterium sp. BRmetb2]MCC7558349.1 carbon-nitrogen hydrolase family protein [Methanobacteriaceae archaeon]